MGEIADMMLDGTLCQCCGDFLGRNLGYPATCASCGKDELIDKGKKNAKKKQAKSKSQKR
jgi:hypothetical protein